jgi:hypothetical protein
MSRLPRFTPEEQRLLRAFASAVLVAMIGLMGFTAWLVVGDVRHAQTLSEVCRKVVAFLDERPPDT